jgi:hypothetical protein
VDSTKPPFVDVKRVSVAHAVFRRAAEAISETVPADIRGDLHSIMADVCQARSQALWLLRLLETRATEVQPRGGFWRDLMRACDVLELREEYARCRVAYLAAVEEVSEGDSGEAG